MNNQIIQSRISFEKMGENYEPAIDVIITKEVIENIYCYWFRCKGKADTNKIVIYLHGGCFVLGSVHSHKAVVSHLAKEIALSFLFIEYGLAPERPFPCGLNDVEKIYNHVLIQHPGIEIILMGDSAGAGLAVSLLSKINKIGLKLPTFIVMISPWVDISCSNKSITENANIDPVLKKERLLELASLYIGNQDLSNVNPIESMVEKFPPSLILVGSEEILLDDSKSIYNKIVQTQAKVKLSIYEKQSHVWLLDDIHSGQSQKAIMEIKAFIRE
jgi:epsilon-lactone hydrolase